MKLKTFALVQLFRDFWHVKQNRTQHISPAQKSNIEWDVFVSVFEGNEKNRSKVAINVSNLSENKTPYRYTTACVLSFRRNNRYLPKYLSQLFGIICTHRLFMCQDENEPKDKSFRSFWIKPVMNEPGPQYYYDTLKDRFVRHAQVPERTKAGSV